MKKAIKKTCVVLLLFALLVSQVAASYSETGTLNEGTLRRLFTTSIDKRLRNKREAYRPPFYYAIFFVRSR